VSRHPNLQLAAGSAAAPGQSGRGGEPPPPTNGIDISQREHAERRIERLTRVLRMQSSINAAVPRLRSEELLQEVCRVATDLGGYNRALYWSVDPTTRTARRLCGSGESEIRPEVPFLELSDGTEPDRSLVGRALRTGELTVCTDLTQTEPPIVGRERFIELGYKSLVAMPLILGGRRLGALVLASKDLNRVGDEELLLLEEIRATLSFALEMRERAGVAEQLVCFNPQTGLATRKLLCDRLERLLRERSVPQQPLTVAVFDIHGLASINDSYGRRIGDILLQKIAERLGRAVESPDRIGYLDGGVFALAQPRDGCSAENIAGMLDGTVFASPFEIEGHTIRVSYTLGLAESEGHGTCADSLVQNAEAALRRAKDTGEQYLHYRLQMHSEIAARLDLQHRLRIALDEQQFVVYYQPQVNVETGQIESAEALLRWNDPARGLIMPGEFLPVLESSGMIVPVGNWVLEQAVRDLRHWRSLGLGPVRVSVNVSALQLRRRTFVDDVLETAKGLNEGGFGLDLEITETSLLQDLDVITAKLHPLRSTGIRIALDDFGTGYSSLGLLTRLPVDVLKIDRSFIRGLPADCAHVALTSSIVQLASAFRLATIAEGVETREQLDQLRKLGCTRIQGQVYSKPLPEDQFQRLLYQKRW
jgi:diguanylate cyclase (GGDEF)-like protein